MAIEYLDWLRGWFISGVIVFLVAYGLSRRILSGWRTYRKELLFGTLSGTVCVFGLGLFAIFHLVSGWEAYFQSISQGQQRTLSSEDFSGVDYVYAVAIEALGSLSPSGIGIFFGVIGLVCGLACFFHLRKFFRRLESSE